jgi:hypothetical protein
MPRGIPGGAVTRRKEEVCSDRKVCELGTGRVWEKEIKKVPCGREVEWTAENDVDFETRRDHLSFKRRFAVGRQDALCIPDTELVMESFLNFIK